MMLDMMDECDMLSSTPTEPQLRNPLTDTIASPEQMHDLLNFRKIGQAAFEDHVRYCILHTPTADTPHRRKHLQTFGSTKQTKKK